MPWSNNQFIGELTIPTGATTGARITINHGGDGAIKVYDASNTLIAELSAAVSGLAVMGAPGTVSATDAAGNVAELVSDIPGGGTLAQFPGLVMQLLSNTGDPATVGALDDGTGSNRALLLTSPSPVVGGIPGTDYSQIYMVGSDASPTQINVDARVFQVNSATTFDANGIIDSYVANTFRSYTPVLGNDGTATYSNRTGWWREIGKMIFFNAYFVVNAAGSGASNLTLTAPVSIDRNNRQRVVAGIEGATAGNNGSGTAVAFTTGSGATFDRVRNSTGGNLTGADLSAGAILDFQGWIRRA